MSKIWLELYNHELFIIYHRLLRMKIIFVGVVWKRFRSRLQSFFSSMWPLCLGNWTRHTDHLHTLSHEVSLGELEYFIIYLGLMTNVGLHYFCMCTIFSPPIHKPFHHIDILLISSTMAHDWASLDIGILGLTTLICHFQLMSHHMYNMLSNIIFVIWHILCVICN